MMKNRIIKIALYVLMFALNEAYASADLIDYITVSRRYQYDHNKRLIIPIDITAQWHDKFKQPITLNATTGTYIGSIGDSNVITGRFLGPAGSATTFSADNTYIAAGTLLKTKLVLSRRLALHDTTINLPAGFTLQDGVSTTTTARDLLYDKAIYFGLPATPTTTQAQLITMIDDHRYGLWQALRTDAAATSGGLDTIKNIRSRKVAQDTIINNP